MYSLIPLERGRGLIRRGQPTPCTVLVVPGSELNGWFGRSEWFVRYASLYESLQYKYTSLRQTCARLLLYGISSREVERYVENAYEHA